MTFQLKYFDARGAAEVSRVLFAIGEQDYEDIRYEFDKATRVAAEFTAAKESGELKVNFNRVPVLRTDDGVTSIGQSKSIERYLARRFGLMGQSPNEDALVDCIAEHVGEIKQAASKKGFSMFTRGKSEEEKAQARKEWFETDFPAQLKKLDTMVTGETSTSLNEMNGFAVGKALTYADVMIWSMIRDCSPTDQEYTAKAAEKCEALEAIADNVSSDPRVEKWINERPSTSF